VNSKDTEFLKTRTARRKLKAVKAKEQEALEIKAQKALDDEAPTLTCVLCGKEKERRFFVFSGRGRQKPRTCLKCLKTESLAAKAERHRIAKQRKKEEKKLAREAAVKRRQEQRAKERNARLVSAVDKEMAARELARRRLEHFTLRFLPNYMPGWVHRDICRRLERFSEQVAAKQSPRLMLLLPPRHGKSELASVRFPAWHLGRHPDHEIIGASYNLDLPLEFSRKIRDTFKDPAFQVLYENARLSDTTTAIERWVTTMGGGYLAAGVGGGITGKGAHILLIDDPLKNWEEAESVTQRDKVWNWYMSTAYSRLAPGGGVLIIETWWHDDDLVGRLLERMRSNDPDADVFEVVKYPALAEADEYLTESDQIAWVDPETGRVVNDVTDFQPAKAQLLRRKGAALHPERYSEAALRRIRATLTPRIWSALYQQNPVPDEGVIFRKELLRYAPAVPSGNVNLYQAWDFAITEKQSADWTVGTMTVQDTEDNLYLHPDIRRFRESDGLALVDAMLDFWEAHRSACPGGPLLGVEDGQIWRALRALFERRCHERKLYPAVELLKPITDKVVRARPLQGRMQLGKYYLPANGGPLVERVVHELLRFPQGVHDDCVDSPAWGAHLAIMRPPPLKARERKVKSWKDRLNEFGRGADTSYMAA
jgi:predicted phage terminase large subunit-like protein